MPWNRLWVLTINYNRPIQRRFCCHPWETNQTWKWKDIRVHKQYFDWLGVHLGHKQMEDWYSVSQEHVNKNGGSALIRIYYGGSCGKALQTVYPEHDWLMWKFNSVPNRYWKEMENQVRFMDWLGVQLGFKTMDDWYTVTQDDFQQNGGSGLSSFYDFSPSKILENVYPQHKWLSWRFHSVPNSYWEGVDNQRSFFKWMGSQMGYTKMEDWYNVTQEDFHKYGAGRLFVRYSSSPSKTMQAIYPEHQWMPWRFRSCPRGYWDKVIKDGKEMKNVADWLAQQLSVKTLDDWYRVSKQQVLRCMFIESSNTLVEILSVAYPEHKWDLKRFPTAGKHSRASQRELFVRVKQLFPRHG